MCRFHSKLELPVGSKVETRTGGLQLADAGWPFLDEYLDRGSIAQCGSRSEGVLPVELGRISSAERGGNPALRIGGRAVKE